MQIMKYPERKDWDEILRDPHSIPHRLKKR